MKEFSLAACSLVLFFSSAVWAGCKTDCLDEYNSAVDDCHYTYSEPDDSDSLQQCLQDAKDEYDDCIENCES